MKLHHGVIFIRRPVQGRYIQICGTVLLGMIPTRKISSEMTFQVQSNFL